MNIPPFFWRGADAIPDYVDWLTEQQVERERLEAVVIEEGDDG